MWYRDNAAGECKKTASGKDDTNAVMQEKLGHKPGNNRTHLSGGKLPRGSVTGGKISVVFRPAAVGLAGKHPEIAVYQRQDGQQPEKHAQKAFEQNGQHQRDQRRRIQTAVELVHAVAAGHHFLQPISHKLRLHRVKEKFTLYYFTLKL